MRYLFHILAVLAGMLLGGLTAGLIEMGSSWLYPAPEGMDFSNREQLHEFVSTLPLPAFLIVLVAWITSAFVGPWVARRLAPDRSAIPGLIVGALFILAPIANLIMIPHPVWMWPAALVACPLMGLFALALSAPPQLKVATIRSIQAPVERVFQTLAQVENFAQAVPGITKIEFLSDQKYGVGTRFKETRMMNGKQAATELEVTELDENRSIRIVSEAGGTCWDTVFKVKPSDGATEMSMQMDAFPQSLFARLLTPMIIGMVDKAVKADMDAVKDYCEARGMQQTGGPDEVAEA